MDIRWLQDFLTLVETASFTRAAEIRCISQAAFSRRIQNLEEWLGTPLIDRSTYPTRLTPEGERFRERAAEIVQQVTDAKLSMAGSVVGRSQRVRIALPHTLATGRLSTWWSEWSRQGTLNVACTAVPGNVHDTVTALVCGAADILVCFHTAQQPIHLSSSQYDRIVIGTEEFKPYVAASLVKEVSRRFPGSKQAPLSLLMYAPGAYLARMVDLIVQSARPPLVGRCVFESDMADVLRTLAVAGHGIAWLPDCCAQGAPAGALAAIDAEGWSLSLSVVAYCDKQVRRGAVERLWSVLSEIARADRRMRAI